MTGLPPLRDVIRHHGLGAKKSLGQNFLLDLNLTSKIARCARDLAGSDVIEIGPGPGSLTRALLDEGARRVHVIERDERCLNALADIEAAYPDRMNIISGDALEIDISDLGKAPRRIVANLPYNIATPLLMNWLSKATSFEQMVLMFQSEVADRLTASPGTKAYGRLSIATQWRCEVRRAFTVPANAFTPPPKVASAIVVLTPRSAPIANAGQATLERVTALAFGQRRKMLRSSLKQLALDFDDLGIDPQARAEELSIEQFCAIARSVDGGSK